MKRDEYFRNVFINCPFDSPYKPIFEAVVFAIRACAFQPRCARERLNSAEVRIDRIASLIAESRYSIHDLSRVELDEKNQLPRFNMPFELGIDFGCRRFSPDCADKTALILTAGPHDYQKYISDLAGQDPLDHGNDPLQAIKQVRNWLRTESGTSEIPAAANIARLYNEFRLELPSIASELGHDPKDLLFADFCDMIDKWLFIKTKESER